MRVAIYQPQFLPRLHYFNRALTSDEFVVLGTAQYTKRLVHDEDDGRQAHPSYQSQSPIKAPGGAQLLRVAISGSRRRPITETQLVHDRRWRDAILRTVEYCYARAPFYGEYAPEISALLDPAASATLADLDVRTFLWGTTRLLGIDLAVPDLDVERVNAKLPGTTVRLSRIVTDDEIPRRPDGAQQGTAWTIAICRSRGATEYVHGGTARTNYMDADAYARTGIALVEQEWRCREYPQLHLRNAGFVANLSVLDALMNAGPDAALDVVLDRQRVGHHSHLKET